MKVRLLILSLFICTTSVFSQFDPDYTERSFQTIKDSISYSQYSGDATSGVIDEEKYIMGPGDVIFISISGIEEVTFNSRVNYEGNLYIPRVGGIDLKNKSLSESKSIIIERLNRYYKDVEIFISLAEFRRIKVSLIGDVVTPSTVALKSNARLLDLLRSSEGLTTTSNYRNIIIQSLNGETKVYDLLSFFRKGDFSNNPLLKEGDVVKIDKTDEIVSIFGQIKFSANYEFIEGENILQLIELAGGLLTKARKDSIELIRFADDGKLQFSLYFSYDEILSNPEPLKNKDLIIVRELTEYMVPHYVRVDGKIKYPGFYKIKKDTTKLSEIIQEAGGWLEEASLNNAYLLRTEADSLIDPEYERLKLMLRADMTDDEYDYLKAKSRQRSGKVVVDFHRLLKENRAEEDIILKKNDYIYFPEEKNYIIMLGQVVKPGKIIFNPGFSISDYIQLAGGFGWRALEGDVRIIKVNTGEWIDADDIDQLDPGDTIWVPEDPPGPKFWDVFTTSLQVLGQVAAVVAATIAVIVATR
ncbi:MAG: polysaccharide biosynthesis/export family protein [Ignavibacteriaceae bacterium]